MIALPVAQGCGGDDAAIGSNPTSDAGGDESTLANPDGSAPSDGSAPIVDTGTPDPFCAALSSYDSRCSLTDSCDVAKLGICAQDESAASAGAIAAYEACAAQEPCPGSSSIGDGGLKAYDDCLATHFGSPTTEEKTIVAAYCARCGTGPDCETGTVAQTLVTFDDAILTEIQDTCLDKDGGADDGGFGGKCANFGKCSRDIIFTHDPQPAACGDQ